MTRSLGPMIFGLVAILCPPALLWATERLEHLIAEPESTGASTESHGEGMNLRSVAVLVGDRRGPSALGSGPGDGTHLSEASRVRVAVRTLRRGERPRSATIPTRRSPTAVRSPPA